MSWSAVQVHAIFAIYLICCHCRHRCAITPTYIYMYINIYMCESVRVCVRGCVCVCVFVVCACALNMFVDCQFVNLIEIYKQFTRRCPHTCHGQQPMQCNALQCNTSTIIVVVILIFVGVIVTHHLALIAISRCIEILLWLVEISK